MNLMRSSIFRGAIFLASVSASWSSEFSSVEEAVALVQDEDSQNWTRQQEAEAYLLKNQKDSLPILMRAVKKKEEGWIACAYILAKSENQAVVPLFIDLVRKNFFVKETDGSRMEFGFASKNGCETITNQYGAVLASLLGSIGDAQAIAVLKEAAKQGDPEVQGSAYKALCELGEISFDEIFDIAKTADPATRLPDILIGVIDDLNHSNPKRAVALYDRVIAEFPKESYEVASAHYWKIQCYRNLKNFDRALEQCDVVLKVVKFENLTEQMAGMKAEISKSAQSGRNGD
jgi:tetratricopeptide (TPR) repeat protein